MVQEVELTIWEELMQYDGGLFWLKHQLSWDDNTKIVKVTTCRLGKDARVTLEDVQCTLYTRVYTSTLKKRYRIAGNFRTVVHIFA